MDEPLGALDKKLREEIQAEISRKHQELAVTIVYVTDDQEEALRLTTASACSVMGAHQIGTGKTFMSGLPQSSLPVLSAAPTSWRSTWKLPQTRLLLRLPAGTAIYRNGARDRPPVQRLD